MALPNRPSIEEISTAAEPGPAWRNGSSRRRESITAARRFTLRVASHTSSSMSSTTATPGIPAAWTKPPRVPSSAAARATAASSPEVSATSTADQWAADPWRSPHNAAVSSAPSASMSHTATGRPTSARASAVCLPIPEPPPVTSTPVPGEPRRCRAGPATPVRSSARPWAGLRGRSATAAGWPGPVRTAPGRPRPSRHRWPGRPRPHPARRRGCSSCRPGTTA